MTDTEIQKIKGGEVVEGSIAYLEDIEKQRCGGHTHCIVTYHRDTGTMEINVNGQSVCTEYEVIIGNSCINFANHSVIGNVTTLFDIFKNYFEMQASGDIPHTWISCKDNDDKLQITVRIDLSYIRDEVKFDIPMRTNVEKQCEKMTPLTDAVTYLGLMYETGKGVEQDYEEAIKYYKMAIEKGNGKAMNNLGRIYYNGDYAEQNYEEAIKYYKMAIEKGEEHAMNNLGIMYEHGHGVEQNYEEAIKYYKMAIEKGPGDAMHNLGMLYEYGHGVEQNYEEAIKYYKMAIEKGNCCAINNLGRMYDNGHGVEQNFDEAIKYYKMAIEKGNGDAMNNLGIIYEFGKGIERNYEEAIKYYKMAIEKDHEKAKSNIGVLIPKLNEVDNQTKLKCYKSLMQNEKTQEYAKRITIKCDIEEISNLHDTIEELRKKLDN